MGIHLVERLAPHLMDAPIERACKSNRDYVSPRSSLMPGSLRPSGKPD
jgi:hypothetical protein